MKTELEIKTASNVATVNGCSHFTENSCGIMYRNT